MIIFKFASKQALFEHAVTHLFTQGEKSVRFEECSGERVTRCRYRHVNDDGKTLMCAVGACIPDELYSEELEGDSVVAKALRELLPKICDFEYDRDTENMLCRVQSIHDNFAIETWHKGLLNAAKEYNLDVSFMKRIESPLLPKSTEV